MGSGNDAPASRLQRSELARSARLAAYIAAEYRGRAYAVAIAAVATGDPAAVAQLEQSRSSCWRTLSQSMSRGVRSCELPRFTLANVELAESYRRSLYSLAYGDGIEARRSDVARLIAFLKRGVLVTNGARS